MLPPLYVQVRVVPLLLRECANLVDEGQTPRERIAVSWGMSDGALQHKNPGVVRLHRPPIECTGCSLGRCGPVDGLNIAPLARHAVLLRRRLGFFLVTSGENVFRERIRMALEHVD